MSTVELFNTLTPREMDYCKYFIIKKGKENTIAQKMFISYNTIKTHKRAIFDKLAINSSIELMFFLLTNKEVLDKLKAWRL